MSEGSVERYETLMERNPNLEEPKIVRFNGIYSFIWRENDYFGEIFLDEETSHRGDYRPRHLRYLSGETRYSPEWLPLLGSRTYGQNSNEPDYNLKRSAKKELRARDILEPGRVKPRDLPEEDLNRVSLALDRSGPPYLDPTALSIVANVGPGVERRSEDPFEDLGRQEATYWLLDNTPANEDDLMYFLTETLEDPKETPNIYELDEFLREDPNIIEEDGFYQITDKVDEMPQKELQEYLELQLSALTR